MLPLQSALSGVSLFAGLRPDEIGRIARRVRRISVASGDSYTIDAQPGSERLVLVLSGLFEAVLEDPIGEVHERLRAGDRYGDARLLVDNPRRARFEARLSGELGLIERRDLDAIISEFPAVALPLAEDLASELRARNDQIRQVLELRASRLSRRTLSTELSQLRQSFVLSSVAVRRISTGGLFRRLVVERGSEPPFWMLLGFLVSLGGARLVVYLILKYKLEKELFALVVGPDPNPVHIHHFNYGLLVTAMVGVVALSQFGRKALRTLAFLFGVGTGLVFDEFALFWNLNPDYAQGSSLISAALFGGVLVQLVYFRRFWLALLGRFVQRLPSE